MHGQGEAHRTRAATGRLTRRAAALMAIAVLCGAAAPTEAGRVTPSGMPVPRYVSLKFDKVNARSGPGGDHKLLWVYQVRGLPVQIVAETSEWRRICDPEGGLVWVHKRTTDGRQMVMNRHLRSVSLLKRPKSEAKPAAYLSPRSLAALVKCEDGWCRIKADGASGWVREGQLWGTDQAPQCR